MFRPKSPTRASIIVLILTAIVAATIYFAWTEFGPANPMLSIIVNYALMTWCVLCVQQLNPSFNSPYFESKQFEKNGAIYPKLGILFFRWLLVVSRWDAVMNGDRKSLRTLEGLHEFEQRTRASEASHAVIAIIVFGLTLLALFQGSWSGVLWLTLSNLFFNVYPVMLQRYNRPITQQRIRDWQGD